MPARFGSLSHCLPLSHPLNTDPLDMRLPENKAKIQNRSINLALSTRGLTALKGSGLALDELIMKSGLPMRGRMLHIGQEGNLVSQDYGVHGEVIAARRQDVPSDQPFFLLFRVADSCFLTFSVRMITPSLVAFHPILT